MGVSHTVGDALTYVVRSEQSGRFIECSVLRPADPKRDGIPNLRVPFGTQDSRDVDGEIKASGENISWKSISMKKSNTRYARQQRPQNSRTNKHKVHDKFYNAIEQPDSLGLSTENHSALLNDTNPLSKDTVEPSFHTKSTKRISSNLGPILARRSRRVQSHTMKYTCPILLLVLVLCFHLHQSSLTLAHDYGHH